MSVEFPKNGFLIVLAGLLSFSVLGENKKDDIRIVSLSPSLTEIIFKLGKGSAMAGRSSACDYPAEVKKIPVAGKYGAPFLETLVHLKTDIVVASSLMDVSTEKSIQTLGIKFQMLPTKDINDYFKAVESLGEILNCKEQAALEIARVKTGLAGFQSALSEIPENEKPFVYLELWNSPMMTVGGKSFINDYIAYAGGKNIGAAVEKEYFACSEEWVISSNPQIIIAPSMGKSCAAEIRGRKCWINVPAVKDDRIYVDLNSNLIFRLGPRMLDGIELLKSCIRADKGMNAESNSPKSKVP